MRIQTKMLKKLVAVLCAATMVASGTVASVGAVNVAPSHACNQNFVSKVNNLNNKLDELTNALKLLQQRVCSIRDSLYIRVDDQNFYVPSNDEGFDNIDVLYGRISGLMHIVDRIRGIETARSETCAKILSSYLDTVTKEILGDVNMTNYDINNNKVVISKNILKYRDRISELANQLVKEDNTLKPTNNNKNNNNNIINNINNIDFKNINNNRIKNNNNIKPINNHKNNNNNNNNHNNNIIINNINNNLNNSKWNLNYKDKINATTEIIRIKDCIFLLNDDKNIKDYVAFAKGNGCSTALHRFECAFFGPQSMKYADVHTRGLYPIITKHLHGQDYDGRKGYIGQYAVLENLRKVYLELTNCYFMEVSNKKRLTDEEFRSKIKQKAKEADDLLNTIARLLGEQ